MHDWKASLKGLHYKHSDFPLQEKSYTEPELHNKANQTAGYIFTPTGIVKPALLSHLCSGQSALKERDLFGFITFVW